MNQMILPTINSFDFSNPSVLNIQPIDTYSAQHQLFIENIKDAKSIEKGNLKLLTTTHKNQTNLKVLQLINRLIMLPQYNFLLNSTYELNPYLQASIEESLNSTHQAFWGNHIAYPPLEYINDTLDRLGKNIVKSKSALKLNTQQAELQAQNAEQKENVISA